MMIKRMTGQLITFFLNWCVLMVSHLLINVHFLLTTMGLSSWLTCCAVLFASYAWLSCIMRYWCCCLLPEFAWGPDLWCNTQHERKNTGKSGRSSPSENRLTFISKGELESSKSTSSFTLLSLSGKVTLEMELKSEFSQLKKLSGMSPKSLF